MRWLTQEFDSRDPKNDLQDIDTGKFLQALQTVPGYIRSMLEDNSMHVELDEVDGHWRIVKIVKQREAAYLQGSEQYFVYDDEGKRIPLSEEEYDQMLGINHNPEDVYNYPGIDFTTLDSEQTTPMDKWDIIFDATEFIREASRAIDLHNSGVYKLEPGVLEKMADETIYSADWFPYPVDKRLTARAKKVAEEIKQRGMTRQQLAAALRTPEDQRVNIANDLQKRANSLPLGPQRAQLMKKAQLLKSFAMKDKLAGKFEPKFSSSEKRQLWDIWRDEELKRNGKVSLMSWQFERAYKAKLRHQISQGTISISEARQMLSERMKSLYDSRVQNQLEESPEMPEWLREAESQQSADSIDDFEFNSPEWLESDWSNTIEDQISLTEEDWQTVFCEE